MLSLVVILALFFHVIFLLVAITDMLSYSTPKGETMMMAYSLDIGYDVFVCLYLDMCLF